jgi:hypothetical protein
MWWTAIYMALGCSIIMGLMELVILWKESGDTKKEDEK